MSMKFSCESKELYRTVTACAKSCGEGFLARPVTECVELVCKGNTLTITALDGFTMVQKVIKVNGECDGSCAIKPDTILRALKGNKGEALVEVVNDITGLISGEVLRIVADGISMSANVYDGEYIKHGGLWSRHDCEYTTIYVNPKYLARVAETVATERESVPVIALDVPHNPHAPLIVHRHGAEDRGLVLPVRVV